MRRDELVFDLAVVGGGITGSAVARDAALRGLSVVLYERGDFASGTTSRTSRLIHGGLRYLEGLHLGLVAESLRERDWLFARLGHLLRALPILIPIYQGEGRRRSLVWAGITLYDLLARRKATPRYGMISPQEVVRRVPGIRTDGLIGGALFYDYQVLVPERLVVENLLGAVGLGAKAFNYREVEEIGIGDAGIRIGVRDRFTGGRETVMARVVINATGPWADSVRRISGLAGEILYPTKGTHVVLPGSLSHALFTAAPSDGRLFYVIPFGNEILVGTTDTGFEGDPGAVEATAEEVTYLLEGVRNILPDSKVFQSMPAYTYAGVRPLLRGGERSASRVSRKHGVFREGHGGRVITIAGGKMTTFRQMAEDAVDAACAVLGRRSACRSRAVTFPGEIEGGREGREELVRSIATAFGVDEALCCHLVSLYGRRAARVLEVAAEDPVLLSQLSSSSPDIAAQAVVAAREEWARTPDDAIMRRLHVGTTLSRGRDALPVVEKLPGCDWATELQAAR